MSNSCDPVDCGPQGFSVHGISQARILEWVIISFSRGSSPLRDQTQVSYIANRFFTAEPEKSMSLMVKNPSASTETEVSYPLGKILWRRKWQPTPVFLPVKSHGQRSLAGYSPWGSQRVRLNSSSSNNNKISQKEKGKHCMISPI